MKSTSRCAAIAGFVTTCACAQELIVHPTPDAMPRNPDYTVKVRVPGGEWRELFPYAVEVDMHQPHSASMVSFDFSGSVEVAVTSNRGEIHTARVRPLAGGIVPEVLGNTLTFALNEPRNLSVEINGGLFDNLHLFANPLERDRPDPNDPNVIYFGPGMHTAPDDVVSVPSGKTLYLAGGAVLRAKILCDRVENVRIRGRGILFQGPRGVEVTHSSGVEIADIIVINPRHYTVYGGESRHLTIRNLRAFSSRGWSDGIDLMSCSDVLVDGVFMRNSDDCIAIYGHRWKYSGDVRNIVVRNSTLWADVAHPIQIGTHGNPAKPETIEDLLFSNIDILEHDERQLDYQGCMSINVSDENLARNIRFEDIRVDDFNDGQLVNLRVTYNRKYATAPGRGIENITFKNITYTGTRANPSIISGYDATRSIRGVVFENLVINGREYSWRMQKPVPHMQVADVARMHVGAHVEGVEFLPPGGARPPSPAPRPAGSR